MFVTVRYSEMLEDLKKDPESHGGPPDCIVSIILIRVQLTVAVMISPFSC